MMKLVEILLEISRLAVQYRSDVIACLVAQGTHLFGVLGTGPQDAVNILQQSHISPPGGHQTDRHLMALR
jgi:hypothetical protein